LKKGSVYGRRLVRSKVSQKRGGSALWGKLIKKGRKKVLQPGVWETPVKGGWLKGVKKIARRKRKRGPGRRIDVGGGWISFLKIP